MDDLLLFVATKALGPSWPELRGSIQPDPANTPQITKKGIRIIEHMMGDESAGTHDGWFLRRVTPVKRYGPS